MYAKNILIFVVFVIIVTFIGCEKNADKASNNTSVGDTKSPSDTTPVYKTGKITERQMDGLNGYLKKTVVTAMYPEAFYDSKRKMCGSNECEISKGTDPIEKYVANISGNKDKVDSLFETLSFYLYYPITANNLELTPGKEIAKISNNKKNEEELDLRTAALSYMTVINDDAVVTQGYGHAFVRDSFKDIKNFYDKDGVVLEQVQDYYFKKIEEVLDATSLSKVEQPSFMERLMGKDAEDYRPYLSMLKKMVKTYVHIPTKSRVKAVMLMLKKLYKMNPEKCAEVEKALSGILPGLTNNVSLLVAEEIKEYYAQGYKNYAQGDKYYAQAAKDNAEAAKHRAEGDRLKAEGDKLKAEAEEWKIKGDEYKNLSEKYAKEADALEAQNTRDLQKIAELDRKAAESLKRKEMYDRKSAEVDKRIAALKADTAAKKAEIVKLDKEIAKLDKGIARYKKLNAEDKKIIANLNKELEAQRKKTAKAEAEFFTNMMKRPDLAKALGVKLK